MRLLETLLAAFLLCTAPLALARDDLPPSVAQALTRAGVPLSSVAVVAQQVDAKKPLIQHNAAVSLNPGSVMKLVTTLAALDLLGPTYNWRTEVYLNGPLNGDVLEGDLLIKGYGDPKLTIEQFWLLLHELRARGLREIRGDLVLDRSWFDLPPHDPGGFDKEPTRPYNVGADALLLNYKSARYRLVPDAQTKRVLLLAEPRLAGVDIDNRLTLSDGACIDWRGNLQLQITEHAEGANLRFSGAYPLSCGEKDWNVALLPHPQFVHSAFKSLWTEMGGSFTGKVREGVAPVGALPFATQKSAALPEVLRDMNKFSNNAIARHVFLTLSAEGLQQRGRYDLSTAVVREWLKQRNLDFPDLILENGSGLSRMERLSAGSTVKLLLAAYQSPLMPEFIATLPLLARDGTMQRRMKNDGAAGQAHIKTGSLEDVRSMAGYMLNRKGQRIAFAFTVNHPKAGASQEAQDVFLRWLYDTE